MKIYHIVPVVMIIFLTSCTKDHEAPMINIQSINEGDTIKLNNGKLSLNMIISDNEELHEMSVTIKKSITNEILYQENPMVHEMPSFQYQPQIALPELPDIYRIQIDVSVSDHSDHLTKIQKSVYISK